jgi:hypothetical protein
MSTVREVISRVRGTEKLLSSDASITDRVIMRELKSKAITFIKQQTDKRRLWQTSTIFSNIPCLEMVTVPTSDCCDYVSDQQIARSRYRLPKISEGVFGLLVHGVFAVDNGKRLKEVTLSRYINLLKLGLPVKDIYYWFYDRYLYVSSPYVKVVNIWAYFEEDIPDNLLYPDCECPNQRKKNPCSSPLDDEFKCPGFLEDAVVKDTLKTLMETYFKVPVDHNSDNLDEQVNKK